MGYLVKVKESQRNDGLMREQSSIIECLWIFWRPMALHCTVPLMKVIERFNHILKERMYKRFTHLGHKKWVSIILINGGFKYFEVESWSHWWTNWNVIALHGSFDWKGDLFDVCLKYLCSSPLSINPVNLDLRLWNPSTKLRCFYTVTLKKAFGSLASHPVLPTHAPSAPCATK